MRRKLTPAETKAYADLARAAKKLRRAMARAERRRERAQGYTEGARSWSP